MIAGSIAPIIAVSLLSTFEFSVPVAIYLAVACLITALVVLTLKETRGLSLHDIDEADAAASAARSGRECRRPLGDLTGDRLDRCAHHG